MQTLKLGRTAQNNEEGNEYAQNGGGWSVNK